MKAVLALVASVTLLSLAGGDRSLYETFRNPPDAAKPWCYWYWVNGNVDEEAITADLEAMKRVGFGGLLLLDPRGYDKAVWKPEPKMAFGGEEWRRMVVFSVKECARLGLEFTMNLSDCGGSLKGPWLTGADAPKQLVCCVGDEPVPTAYTNYHDIALFAVRPRPGTKVASGWRNAGGVVNRWAKDADEDVIPVEDWREVTDGQVPEGWLRLRFGYSAIPGREHDVDVIDAAAVERHFKRITEPLFAALGPLVGTTFTYVYSVSWEGAIPTWTPTLEREFKSAAGYDLRPHLPELANFVLQSNTRMLELTNNLLRDYRRVRNTLFKDKFYGTVRRLAHARGLKLYSESGGPWNRDPSVFREADQLAFLGVNDMPQGENWPVAPSHHTDAYHNRAAANAAHIYGLPRASAETFTHMDYHYSMWPEKLKKVADDAFVDGINHIVWHTFTCSPKAFGQPGIEYFAGTHINRNVTWFEESRAFLAYLARCQVLLQAGEPVTDIAIYAGHTPYQHWGRYRTVPWDGARLSIPAGYNYDLLNDETLERRKGAYPVFVDASGDNVVWPKLPPPDFEGDFNDVIHRRTVDGTDIYFVTTIPRNTGVATFRVDDKVAELWDPVSGTRRLATEAKTLPDGRVKIPLKFPRGGSVFVVFRARSVATADPAPTEDWPPRRKPVRLTDSTWTIDIGGRPYGRLGDWTKADDPEIRYFAGKASYRTTFEFQGQPTDRTLYLGRVAGGLAEVFVNGRSCGVAWCHPYRVKVPAALLKSGRNELEVKVVNTWRNRLIGDCLLPPERRHAKGCLVAKPGSHNDAFGNWGFWNVTGGYSANDELDASGLYGPVELW